MDGLADKLSPKKVLKVGDMEKVSDPADLAGGNCVGNFRKDLLKSLCAKSLLEKWCSFVLQVRHLSVFRDLIK